jgi:hypothetical protein
MQGFQTSSSLVEAVVVDFGQTLHQIQKLSGDNQTTLDESETCEELNNTYLLPLLQGQTRLADQTQIRFEVAEVAEVA